MVDEQSFKKVNPNYEHDEEGEDDRKL